jgi:hypothetical protein
VYEIIYYINYELLDTHFIAISKIWMSPAIKSNCVDGKESLCWLAERWIAGIFLLGHQRRLREHSSLLILQELNTMGISRSKSPE